MGHAPEDVGDLYSKLKDDVACRQEWAERVGLGFELVHIGPQNVTPIEAEEVKKWRKPLKGRVLEVVGANGFEPSTSWSRTRDRIHLSHCPGVTYGFSGRSLLDKFVQVFSANAMTRGSS